MDFKEKPKYSGIKQLFITGPCKKYLPENLIFKNFLNDFDLNSPSNEMIEHMIKSGFYGIQEWGHEYFPDFTFEDYTLGCEIFYNNTPYLYSDLFKNELFDYLKGIVEDLYNRNFEKDKFSVELYLKGCINTAEELDFLKNLLKECHSVDSEHAENFLSYLTLGSEWWKDWITASFSEEDEIYHYYFKTTALENLNNSKIIDNYLPIWLEFYRREKIIQFCRSKIDELHNNDKSKNIKNPPSLSSLVFTDDGEDVFNHINSHYVGEKNKAFYSYLYFYLQSKSKLVNNFKKDSETYRTYVMKKELIENFSRIITSNAYKQERKTDIFLIFDNLMISYSVYSEEKLNKND